MNKFRKWLTVRYERSAWSRLFYILFFSAGANLVIWPLARLDLPSWLMGTLFITFILGWSLLGTWLVTAPLADPC